MLAQEQISTLEILGYVYFRLGKLEEARTVFEALLALTLDDKASNRRARKHLAAIALARKDSSEALVQLSAYLDGQPPGQDAAPILLMQAQAYWIAGRQEESRSAMAQYLRLNQESV